MEKNIPNISGKVIARLIILVLSLINMILVILGKGEIAFIEEEIYQICSVIELIAISGWTAWKDNPITEGARMVEAAKPAIKESMIADEIEIEEPMVEIEEVEFDEMLAEVNMQENGELFKDKLTNLVGEEFNGEDIIVEEDIPEEVM